MNEFLSRCVNSVKVPRDVSSFVVVSIISVSVVAISVVAIVVETISGMSRKRRIYRLVDMRFYIHFVVVVVVVVVEEISSVCVVCISIVLVIVVVLVVFFVKTTAVGTTILATIKILAIIPTQIHNFLRRVIDSLNSQSISWLIRLNRLTQLLQMNPMQFQHCSP